jgi:hypothetical protein
MKHIASNMLVLAVLSCASAGAISQTPASAAAAQSSVAAGVTVKVTPVVPTATGTLEFRIVFDTHSGELSDDLQRGATLTLADGRKLKATRWTGPDPGGHHREGVLAFDSGPASGAVELSIERPGEAQPRIFRWQP